MKVKKKTAMLASFALGALLFTTTALADIASKSGYEQLKDALKLTAANCTEKFDSYTMDISYVVKDNDKTLMSESHVEKRDRVKKAMESISESQNSWNGTTKYSYYADPNVSISKDPGTENYRVMEFTKGTNPPTMTNPFKENRAEDIEKIADAVIGSLKDHVVVTENPDGSKELSGSLTEVQIPPIVNAGASFFFKQQFGYQRQGMPTLTKDIFVKAVKGKAVLNKDGVMENLLGNVVLSGKDDKGQVHELTVELLGKLTGINSTTVTKPDLTGKKVVKEIANKGPGILDPEKFIGKFKNNIIIVKDGKFVKIGERIIEITQMDGKTVAGRYHEEYKPGFDEYAANKSDFNFEGKFDQDPRTATFKSTNQTANHFQGIGFDDWAGKVYLNGSYQNNGGIIFDCVFSPDLN